METTREGKIWQAKSGETNVEHKMGKEEKMSRTYKKTLEQSLGFRELKA